MMENSSAEKTPMKRTAVVTGSILQSVTIAIKRFDILMMCDVMMTFAN
jgi:hypothetical protein